MKVFHNISFSKQLITYLLLALVATFIIIFYTIVSFVDQLIDKNAFKQMEQYTITVRNDFDKEIRELEKIPEQAISIYNSNHKSNLSDLAQICIQSQSQMLSCSIYYNYFPSAKSTHMNQVIAERKANGDIAITNIKSRNIRELDTNQILHKLPHGGFWIYSQPDNYETITLFYPLDNKHINCSGYLSMNFPTNIFIEKIQSYPLYNNEKLFMIDQLNNRLIWGQEANFFTSKEDIQYTDLIATSQGEEYKSYIYRKKKEKYILFHSPLNNFSWYFCIASPYGPIQESSYDFYYILIICLGGGLLLLLSSIISIIIYQTAPLQQLSFMTHQIASGQLNIELPLIKSHNEIAKLHESFSYMQASLIKYIDKLKKYMVKNEQRRMELDTARRIQQRFIPHHIELPSHIHIVGELRQSMEVGGDFYDFFILSNRLYFVIGDVSGKGIPAALHMVSIAKLFRYIAKNQTSTAQICNIINNHMYEDSEDDIYITMFIGILDIHTGEMTYTNAGHPYPLIILEKGENYFMKKYPDAPIGILENNSFSEHHYTMSNNSAILFYTDGITDAENLTGEFYGKDRLVESINNACHKKPQEIIDTLLEEIQKHITPRNPSDDLTLLYLHYTTPTHLTD